MIGLQGGWLPTRLHYDISQRQLLDLCSDHTVFAPVYFLKYSLVAMVAWFPLLNVHFCPENLPNLVFHFNFGTRILLVSRCDIPLFPPPGEAEERDLVFCVDGLLGDDLGWL